MNMTAIESKQLENEIENVGGFAIILQDVDGILRMLRYIDCKVRSGKNVLFIDNLCIL